MPALPRADVAASTEDARQRLLQPHAEQSLRRVLADDPLGEQEPVEAADRCHGAEHRRGGVGAPQLGQVLEDVRATRELRVGGDEPRQVAPVARHRVG